MRVLLAQNAPSVAIASDDDMRVKDANGDSHTLAAGTYTLKPGLKLPVDGQAKPQKLERAADVRRPLAAALAGRPAPIAASSRSASRVASFR